MELCQVPTLRMVFHVIICFCTRDMNIVFFFDWWHSITLLILRQNDLHLADDIFNALLWLNIILFWLICHGALFLSVQFTTIYRRFRLWSGVWRRIGDNPLLEPMVLRASLGHKVLMINHQLWCLKIIASIILYPITLFMTLPKSLKWPTVKASPSRSSEADKYHCTNVQEGVHYTWRPP